MAERIEITLLVDNYVDIFLPSTDHVTYPAPGSGSHLWGEQGLSLWLEIWDKGKAVRILYDFGRSDKVFLHNAQQLNIDIGRADFMVLSHAHGDHYGGLPKAVRSAKILSPRRPSCSMRHTTVHQIWSKCHRTLGHREEVAQGVPVENSPEWWFDGAGARGTRFRRDRTADTV